MHRSAFLIALFMLPLAACGDEDSGGSSDGYLCGEGTHAEGGECVPDTDACSCDSGGSSCEDLDGDGWPRNDGDCDDSDPDVHPGAEEVCNGMDDDCDDRVDVDATDMSDFYPDGDSDSFGDETAKATSACDAPSGYVTDNTDCDDADSSVYPDAEDAWYDGIDSDCYGDNDYDQDSDGYMSSDHDGDDCDDTTTDVGPHMEEICDDGLDNDCDGGSNGCSVEGEIDLLEADAIFTGAAAGDYAGASVAGPGDVDGDGYDDLLLGAPRADTGGANAGDVYLVSGPVSGTMGLDSAAVILYGGDTSDLAGQPVAGAGDVNADGFADLLVGAYGEDSAGSGAGAAYLLHGPVSSGSLLDAQAVLLGITAGDALGFSAAGAGDADGDGSSDLLLGAYGEDSGGSNAGAAYLLSGTSTGELSAGDAAATIAGDAEGENVGWAVAGAGDVNADGMADLLVGAPGDDTVDTDAGQASLFHGPASGSLGMGGADAVLTGSAAGDYAGYALAAAGDVNGDGFDDLLVGAHGEDTGGSNAGVAYVLWGPVAGSRSLTDAELILQGDTAAIRLGISVSCAGDIDNDGQDDLLIGADRYSGGQGAAYLVLGGSSGTLQSSDADAVLVGETWSDWAGFAVAGAGDVNADGRADLLVGAWGNDTTATDAGVIYFFEGHGI